MTKSSDFTENIKSYLHHQELFSMFTALFNSIDSVVEEVVLNGQFFL